MSSACYKTSDNKFFDCPPRMADGRHFTDYRPECYVNDLIRADNNVNNNFYSAFSSSLLNKNILGRISLNNSSTNNIQNVQNNISLLTYPRIYFGPVNIEKIRITLYDEYGRQIVLNNMDWSCALMFECMYS